MITRFVELDEFIIDSENVDESKYRALSVFSGGMFFVSYIKHVENWRRIITRVSVNIRMSDEECFSFTKDGFEIEINKNELHSRNFVEHNLTVPVEYNHRDRPIYAIHNGGVINVFEKHEDSDYDERLMTLYSSIEHGLLSHMTADLMHPIVMDRDTMYFVRVRIPTNVGMKLIEQMNNPKDWYSEISVTLEGIDER